MTDNRTTELLPCPFCGGEARLVNDYSSEKGMSYQIWHECTGHEGRSGSYGQGIKPFFETPWYATDAEAIAAWNTRHVETCRITASSTDGLCSDNPRQYFKLSCGHSFTINGLEAPVACAVCGKVVKNAD